MLILQGDDQVKSRAALGEEKARAKSDGVEIVEINGEKAELGEVLQALESTSLFLGGRLVVIEGLLSSQASKRKEAIVAYLKKNNFDELILWEGKEVGPATLKSLGGRVETFKISPEIFKFMDALAPGRQREILECWTKSLAQGPVEQIFYMLCRQIRLLMVAKEDAANMKDNPYVIAKVKRQCTLFPMNKLIDLHRRLYEIDRGQKTGVSPLSLEQEVELWLLAI